MGKNKLIIKSWRVMIAIVLTYSLVLTGCGETQNKNIEEQVEGRLLLAELEKGNVAELEKQLQEHLDSGNMENSVEENGQSTGEESTGEDEDAKGEEESIDIYNRDYNQVFEDTIFMGDSITEGLFYMEVIDKSKVVASLGASILKAKEDLPTVVSLVPKRVVLLYGMNDVILFDESNEWTTMDSFKANYKELLQTLKNQLPYAEIYVQSPLSVAEGNLNASPRLTNENLDKLRAVVKAVCEEVQVNYVDINPIVEKDESLRAQDGIHLNHDFYIQWLAQLQKEMGM